MSTPPSTRILADPSAVVDPTVRLSLLVPAGSDVDPAAADHLYASVESSRSR